MMMNSGNGDSCRIELEIGGEHFVDCCKDRDRIFGRGVCGSGSVGLDGCDQGSTQPSRFQLAVDAEVVAAESARPGHGDTQDGLACYLVAPATGSLASTALRQRL